MLLKWARARPHVPIRAIFSLLLGALLPAKYAARQNRQSGPGGQRRLKKLTPSDRGATGGLFYARRSSAGLLVENVVGKDAGRKRVVGGARGDPRIGPPLN